MNNNFFRLGINLGLYPSIAKYSLMRIALAMKILKNGPCGVCGSERFGSADAAISKELGYEESVGLAC